MELMFQIAGGILIAAFILLLTYISMELVDKVGPIGGISYLPFLIALILAIFIFYCVWVWSPGQWWQLF